MNLHQPTASWQPTVSIETLRFRAELKHAARLFFRDQGYLEVETPLCSDECINDAHIEPLRLNVSGFKKPFFLQTSPEAGMKRLLAAGAKKIYQFSKAFRNGERGKKHNPEFTMLEWYAVGETAEDQIPFIEKLVRHLWSTLQNDFPSIALPKSSFPVFTYDEAFQKALGASVLDLSAEQLVTLAVQKNILIPEEIKNDRDEILNRLLSEKVEPLFASMGFASTELASANGTAPAIFLRDYPASQAALAKVKLRDDTFAVADRFELYMNGVEVCNGYHELTDAEELALRMEQQNAIRKRNGVPTIPPPLRLLTAMKHGLPACSGVALGWDRIVMLAGGYNAIEEVIAFPTETA